MGTQRWRDLLFMHWSLPAEIVRPLLPAGLELDTWDGEALVGLVPFAMEGVRPWWLPRGMAFQFLETNLRTYVWHSGQRRPGVYFFSLEAASWLAVQAARRLFHLPYHHADMTCRRDGPRFDYATHRRAQPSARLELSWSIGDTLPQPEVGSLEFFLVERYLLFTERRGRILCGQVHHPPYPLRQAAVEEVREGLFAAAGLPPARGMPLFSHFSPGVDVEIFPLGET